MTHVGRNKLIMQDCRSKALGSEQSRPGFHQGIKLWKNRIFHNACTENSWAGRKRRSVRGELQVGSKQNSHGKTDSLKSKRGQRGRHASTGTDRSAPFGAKNEAVKGGQLMLTVRFWYTSDASSAATRR
jgi:hypothetical protein